MVSGLTCGEFADLYCDTTPMMQQAVLKAVETFSPLPGGSARPLTASRLPAVYSVPLPAVSGHLGTCALLPYSPSPPDSIGNVSRKGNNQAVRTETVQYPRMD